MRVPIMNDYFPHHKVYFQLNSLVNDKNRPSTKRRFADKMTSHFMCTNIQLCNGGKADVLAFPRLVNCRSVC